MMNGESVTMEYMMNGESVTMEVRDMLSNIYTPYPRVDMTKKGMFHA